MIIYVFLFLIFKNCYADKILVQSDRYSIQSGIDAAAKGDTVLVSPGRYLESINFKGKSILLGSYYIVSGDTSYISNTIIDGGKRGTVVKFENGEDSLTVICGFTITNGNNYVDKEKNMYNHGTGIHCVRSSPQCKNLIVTGNNSFGEGGGIWCQNSNASFSNILIYNNNGGTFHGAGGVECEGGNPSFHSLKVFNNTGYHGSGGMFFLSVNTLILENVEVVNNFGYYSPAGIWIEAAPWLAPISGESHAILKNVTVSNNSYYKQDIFSCDGIAIYNSIVTMINCIISGYNENISGNCIYLAHCLLNISNTDIIGGVKNIMIDDYYDEYSKINKSTLNILEGNIDADPLFIRPVSGSGSENIDVGDYRLQKNSPCIDTGTAFFRSEDGQTILDLPPSAYKGRAPDMGAFESDYIPVSVSEPSAQPRKIMMISANPNPFNPSTTISFNLTHAGQVNVTIYDVTGRKVKELASGKYSTGKHNLTWDARGQSSGVYICKVGTGEESYVMKMLYLK